MIDAVEEISTRGDLEALEPEWAELWERCPAAGPFAHPAWLLTWWRHFGAGKKLAVFALRENGALVGVAPFCVLPESGARKLMLVGVGLSDFLDVLVAPGFEGAACEGVMTRVADARSRSSWTHAHGAILSNRAQCDVATAGGVACRTARGTPYRRPAHQPASALR